MRRSTPRSRIPRRSPARPGAARLHRPRAHLQARGRHHVPAHRRGWLYLSTAIDLNARIVVGWSFSGRTTADIVISAPASAISRCYVPGNAIFHADRGAQYTSRLMAEWARGNDVRLFCSRTGSRRDSAVAESFFAALKNEMYCRRNFPTGDSARHAVIESIDRGLLQPPQAPLNDRLQGSGRGYGGLLRGNRAQARGNAYGLLIPRASVSEILTRVTNASGTVTYRRSNLSR